MNVSKTEACFNINQKYNSPLSLVEFCDGVHNFVFVAPIVDWSIYIYLSYGWIYTRHFVSYCYNSSQLFTRSVKKLSRF